MLVRSPRTSRRYYFMVRYNAGEEFRVLTKSNNFFQVFVEKKNWFEKKKWFEPFIFFKPVFFFKPIFFLAKNDKNFKS